MALYESTFITNQELTAKQVDDLAQNFADFLKSTGGKLVKKEYWGVRSFSYPIKKQKKGHYIMLCVDCEPVNIVELDKKMKAQEEILKHFNVKVDGFSKDPSNLSKLKDEN